MKTKNIEKITLVIETCSNWKSSTDDRIILYIGKYQWLLDNPDIDDFEKGQRNTFNLEIPKGIKPSWFNYLCIRKESKNQIRGDDWCIQKIEFLINDEEIFTVKNEEIWLTETETTWCAEDFNYGSSKGKKRKVDKKQIQKERTKKIRSIFRR